MILIQEVPILFQVILGILFQVTTLYTAPTAVRAIMAFGDSHALSRDRSSLRIIGSVGEPINPAAWLWLYNVGLIYE